MSLFDASCCDVRWTIAYYRASQRLFCDLPASPSVDVSHYSCSKRRKLSQHEKFRKASVLATELATVVSEASHTRFYWRLELLKDLISSWKSGTEVGIVDFDSGDLIKLEVMHSNEHVFMSCCRFF